ncbi:X-linked lymphocyte-regulated protein 3A-like [Psammomys obesus]|uniref:X-linked lymphocyte-regulated protein 3A-like n=1 Tax=Psammomys obesus TaxID=48139 RepID=UPI002453376C|nr:X-linked lymphocyte-regulated protein 3A-like [Psammomys obesus]
MSSRERKAPDSAGMHPRLDPNVTSDDTQNADSITPANEEVLDVSTEDITPSGAEGQRARKKIQDLFEEFEGPIKIFLKENGERFRAIINESFQTMQKKVEDVLKVQCGLRILKFPFPIPPLRELVKTLYEQYSLQITNLNWKLNMDAGQVKKQAEKLSRIFKEQRNFVLQSLVLQKERMEDFKSLCEQYLEKLEMLKYSWENSVFEELRRLIDTLPSSTCSS